MQNPDTRELTMARSVLLMITCCLLTSCGSGSDDLMLSEWISREAEQAFLDECESRMDELEEEGPDHYFDIRRRVYRDVFRDHAEDLARILNKYLSALPEIDLEDIEGSARRGRESSCRRKMAAPKSGDRCIHGPRAGMSPATSSWKWVSRT